MGKVVFRVISIAVGLVLVALLGLFAAFLWWLKVEWPASGERREAENVRLRSVAAVQELAAAADDGKLTKGEVRKAVGLQWVAERTSESIDIVAYFRVTFRKEETGLCVLYKVSLPLDRATSVTRTELPAGQGPCRGLNAKYVGTQDPDTPVV
ncbi:hypothetical protein [Streptosporangium carneum]|uniref:Uncharacterized protein n=1 Tax=Streptosporangium carneum TaxID=47481 RepID=A0A9W6I931_9ACTN|nr:hypothetical protein [Streptosporangium carneum]GLK13249.1 hypothetical protein GCM10017600_66600 [Streptosporangium carneum]